MRTAPERFDAKWTPEPNSGCWLWTGAIDPKGYGRFSVKLANVYAHRFAYERWKGPIPAGLTIDHLCRVRCCVNPDHLEAVTVAENILRGNGAAARNARKTHCKRGHAFTPANTVPAGQGGRQCRACKLAEQRKRRAARTRIPYPPRA